MDCRPEVERSGAVAIIFVHHTEPVSLKQALVWQQLVFIILHSKRQPVPSAPMHASVCS